MSEIERDPLIRITNERLRRLGVKALLFDLDDTLIDTNHIFTKHVSGFSEVVALSLGLNPIDVLNRVRELNNEEFERHGIDPKKWLVVLDRLGHELGNPDVVNEMYKYIENIYYEEPKILPGVRQILSGLKGGGFLLGQVTHGETNWSIRKNEQTGLINFFDVIVPASVFVPKSKEHWLSCMNYLSVTPKECIVTGDNLKGDIIPAIDLGSRAISLTSPWSVYRQGEMPNEAIKIDKIADFWDAVQKLK